MVWGTPGADGYFGDSPAQAAERARAAEAMDAWSQGPARPDPNLEPFLERRGRGLERPLTSTRSRGSGRAPTLPTSPKAGVALALIGGLIGLADGPDAAMGLACAGFFIGLFLQALVALGLFVGLLWVVVEMAANA